jgi:hypothetical protein
MNKRQAENYVRLCGSLAKHGLTETETRQLLRAERTITRWADAECGDSDNNGHTSIERDEATGKPVFWSCRYVRDSRGQVIGEKNTRVPLVDKETNALNRVKAICDRHGLTFYHQQDCRGCALYIIRPASLPVYRRRNGNGFLKLFRNDEQIASTAQPGDDGTRYLDELQKQDLRSWIDSHYSSEIAVCI